MTQQRIGKLFADLTGGLNQDDDPSIADTDLRTATNVYWIGSALASRPGSLRLQQVAAEAPSFPPIVPQVGRILTTGFEENDHASVAGSMLWYDALAGGVESLFDATLTHVGGTAMRSKHTGLFASSNAATNMTPHPVVGDTVFVRFYVRFVTMPNSFGVFTLNIGAICGLFSSNHVGLCFSLNFTPPNARFALRTDLNGVPKLDGTYTVVQDQWYRVELKILLSDTTTGTSEARVFLDEGTTAVETLSLSGIITNDVSNSGMGQLELGNSISPCQGDSVFDDVAIELNTDWIGPGHTILMHPITAVSDTWTVVGAGSSVLAVGELPGLLDDGGYLQDTTLTNLQRFALSASGIPTGKTLRVLDVYARTGSDGGSSADQRRVRLKIWDEEGRLTDAALLPTWAIVGGWHAPLAWLGVTQHPVANLAGRTVAALDQFTIGFQNDTDAAGTIRRVSALWANVEYVP